MVVLCSYCGRDITTDKLKYLIPSAKVNDPGIILCYNCYQGTDEFKEKMTSKKTWMS